MERLIGRYGKYGAAKTFLIFAGVHGNEKLGIQALEELFEEFEEKQVEFDGTIIGVACNLAALKQGFRYIHKDLNRQWYLSKIRKLAALPYGMLIDLHTTSATGGCFCITNSHPRSLELALDIPVPVINGMVGKIKGTTMEYFDELGLPAIAYEAGQHTEPEAVDRMKAGLVSIFTKTSCLEKKELAPYQSILDKMTNDYAHLPQNVDVVHLHPIEEEDEFVMEPGYINFQEIKKGEHLANDKRGKIFSPYDGLILMPLYQKKGSDGFFIVKELD
jgi:succinylglutamate desuccinylase